MKTGCSTETRGLEAVITEIHLQASPIQVYNAIKSVDTVDVAKPFLMHLGLPVPLHCKIGDECVGGKRTCYFKNGKIEEEIVDLIPGEILGMKVINNSLPGRKWLGFEDAIYKFSDDGKGGTYITRITTYTSGLRPRLYWRYLERWGIEQEHRYIFDNLTKDLDSLNL